MNPKDDDPGVPTEVPDFLISPGSPKEFPGSLPIRQFKEPPKVLLPDEGTLAVTAQQFVDRSGQTKKRGANLADVNPSMVNGMRDATRLLNAVGIGQVYTAGFRDWQVRSHHETGNAVDMRLRPDHASPEKVQDLRDLLNAERSGSPILIRGKKATVWRRGEYEFMIHGEGDGIHLHIEHDTPDTQKQLNELMKSRAYQIDMEEQYSKFTNPSPSSKTQQLANKLKAEREAELRMAKK